MAHSRQALKRLRTSNLKQAKNKSAKKSIKTTTAKLLETAKEKKKDETQKLLSEIYSKIDKAVKQGILHKKTAARKKSRISKVVASSAS